MAKSSGKQPGLSLLPKHLGIQSRDENYHETTEFWSSSQGHGGSCQWRLRLTLRPLKKRCSGPFCPTWILRGVPIQAPRPQFLRAPRCLPLPVMAPPGLQRGLAVQRRALQAARGSLPGPARVHLALTVGSLSPVAPPPGTLPARFPQHSAGPAPSSAPGSLTGPPHPLPAHLPGSPTSAPSDAPGPVSATPSRAHCPLS